MIACACGSTKKSEECCSKYILGKRIAPDPESLMRSRYTAYTELNITYIADTMRGSALAGFDPQRAITWAKQIKWLRLQVLKSSAIAPEDTIAHVEFIVHYLFQGRKEKLHEVSEFHRIEGCWYYVDGKIVTE